MEVSRASSAGAWLADTEAFLREREAESSLPLGLAMAARDSAGGGAATTGWTARDAGRVVGCALLPTSSVLVLSRATDEATDALAQAVADAADAHITGAVGPERSAERFAVRFARGRGASWRRHWTLILHELGELAQPAAIAGRSRRATPEDAEVVARWLEAFSRDTGALVQPHDPRALAERVIEAGRAYLHEHAGAPVALAGWSRPTGRTCTINMVYTPTEFRRRGYARALTTHVARELTARGTQHILLFTNEAEPGPNALYRSLGFAPFARFLEVVFEP